MKKIDELIGEKIGEKKEWILRMASDEWISWWKEEKDEEFVDLYFMRDQKRQKEEQKPSQD